MNTNLLALTGLIAISPLAANADETRTICILLATGTVRVLPRDQTACTPKTELGFTVMEAKQPASRSLTARIAVDGSVKAQDQYPDPNNVKQNWIQEPVVHKKTGVYLLTFTANTFSNNASCKETLVAPPISHTAGCDPTPQIEEGSETNKGIDLYIFTECQSGLSTATSLQPMDSAFDISCIGN